MKLTSELWNNEGQRPTVVEPPKDALNRILSHINSNHFPVKRKKKLMKKMKLINVQFVYVVSRLCSKICQKSFSLKTNMYRKNLFDNYLKKIYV